MVSHAHRRGAPLAAVLLDVDHFKRINDECGHGVGDAVLCQIGELVAPVLRGSDFFGRHGGEEFVLLLPDTTADGAAVVAEKIRVAMGALVTDGLHHPVTVSLGAAELLPGDMDGSELLGNADQALYRAKEGGRDRVEVAQASSTRELVLTH
jgi:diguanylate cyclase